VAALVAGCGDVPAGEPLALAPDQVLRFPIPARPASLDPALARPGTSADLLQNVFEGLLRVDDASGDVVPDLATSLPQVSADGLTYTFHVNPAARFSNGDPVTAQDVAFSWARAATAPGPGPALLAPVDMAALATPDARTVVVHLRHDAAAGDFPRRVAQVAASIVDATVVRRAPATWAGSPDTLVGSGPFKLAADTAGGSLRFVPAVPWWGTPKPSLREVDVDVQPDPARAFDLYTSGTYAVDGFGGMPLPAGGVGAKLKADEDEMHTLAGPGAAWLSFDFRAGPTSGLTGSGPAVRRALAYGLDRAQLARTLCNGGAVCVPAQGGLIPGGMAGYQGVGAGRLSTFAPDSASSLLQQADPSRALRAKLTLAYADTATGRALATALVTQWKANLRLDLPPPVAVPPAAWAAHPDAGGYPLFITEFTPAYNGAQAWYGPLFKSGGPAAPGLSDPTLDSLIGTAEASPAFDEPETYAAAAGRLADDIAYAPIVYDARQVVFKSFLRNVGFAADRDWRWSAIQVLQH